MRARIPILTLAVVTVLACEDLLPPTVGSMRVSVATTGGDLDEDGYLVRVDEGDPRAVDDTAAVMFAGLASGAHSVELAGVATNCTVAGDNPRSVTVAVGDTVQIDFAVSCVATGVEIRTASTGVDLDPDGYRVSVDGGADTAIAVNGEVTVTRLDAGTHSVALSGIADNCSVDGENPRSITIAAGETPPVAFAVTCVATTAAAAVTAATTGIDTPAAAYSVRVNGGPSQPLPINGTVVVAGLPGGDHTVQLADAPGNCAVSGDNPRTVSVSVGGTSRDTARTTFEVGCVATTGVMQVTTQTSGLDLDSDGYSVQVDDGAPLTIGLKDTLTIAGVTGGDHTVTVSGTAANCTVTGDNPRTVTVTTGGVTRDTARTTVELSCTAIWQLALSRRIPVYYGETPIIVVTSGDGTLADSLEWGGEPEWSPDGTQIAFTECDPDYYYYGCYPIGLSRMNTDGSGKVRLTSDWSDNHAAWRPDGSQLAFTRVQNGRRVVFVMNADGSAVAAVPMPAGFQSAEHSTWSPDGATLAFTCRLEDGNDDICLVAPDGTSFVRLTSDPARDARPSWHPDGSQLVFVTTRYGGSQELALMGSDGSGVTRLLPGTAAIHPAWSRDGATIAFSQFACDVYAGCTILGLSRVNADGTALTSLTQSRDYAPAWRP